MSDRRQTGLESLYGKGHADATRTRECVAMPGLREQEILTPPEILGPVRRSIGEISLDPCCPVGANPIRAARCYDDAMRGSGITGPWCDGTFWNPPYGALEVWVSKAHLENVISIGLIPVRTHRTWWWEHMRGVSAFCWLRPVTFLGYDQAFPAPLCLVYRGPDPRTFAHETEHLGTPTLNPFDASAPQVELFAAAAEG